MANEGGSAATLIATLGSVTIAFIAGGVTYLSTRWRGKSGSAAVRAQARINLLEGQVALLNAQADRCQAQLRVLEERLRRCEERRRMGEVP